MVMALMLVVETMVAEIEVVGSNGTILISLSVNFEEILDMEF